jgi:predicted unusual protein kinase regulating ubiquinone biosynthesis (AarF/ABC1/UbiB family)
MTKPDRLLRDELVRRLLAGTADLPTSRLGRFGRTASAALRTARLLVGRRGEGELDPEAIARIVASIGQLKGIAMKVGQIASYVDVTLPEELQRSLAVLQTHAQPMPVETVRGILEAELGERGRVLSTTLEPVPIAAASIGQVHRARLPDGTGVAVKVQYPGIERAIESDFSPTAIGTRIGSLFYPGAEIEAFVAEARTRFLEECDYVHEAAAQGRFARLFRGHPVIAVPDVHGDYGSRRVLTSTWVDGKSFDLFLETGPSRESRDRIGKALFTFYVGSIFTHGLYNCDPHPGNYLFPPDGRIAVLDYGCTREFPPTFVEKLARLTRAVHDDDRDALERSFVELGMVRRGRRYDFDTARSLVRAFHGPMLRDEEQAIELGAAMGLREVYEGKRELLRLSLPGEFLFLLRIRFGLMGVLARLGARANWRRLEAGFISGHGM